MRNLSDERSPQRSPAFWKFELGESFGLKTGGMGTAFPCVPPLITVVHTCHARLSQSRTYDLVRPKSIKTYLYTYWLTWSGNYVQQWRNNVAGVNKHGVKLLMKRFKLMYAITEAYVKDCSKFKLHLVDIPVCSGITCDNIRLTPATK